MLSVERGEEQVREYGIQVVERKSRGIGERHFCVCRENAFRFVRRLPGSPAPLESDDSVLISSN